MTIHPAELRAVPLFESLQDEHLSELLTAFERLELGEGETLFEAGSVPEHLLLLVEGEVALNDGGVTRFRLSPVTLIGEVGAVTGLRRSTTAVTTKPSVVLRVGVEALMRFFEAHGDVARPFYRGLLHLVAEKVRRDTRHLDEMRGNLIRTQKAMKRLRDYVLESPETELSKEVCDTLEQLIEQNRRVHYAVEPLPTERTAVRLDSGEVVQVAEMSDGWLRLARIPAPAPALGADWSGVLVTPSAEIPVSGRVESLDCGVQVRLDMLIDEYAVLLQGHLTRLQMLDFVV